MRSDRTAKFAKSAKYYQKVTLGQPVKEEVGDSGREGGSKFKNADLS